jgi:hypothetical protein
MKSPLWHINGVKCTWYVKKSCTLLYNKTLKNAKKIIMIWSCYHFYKQNTKFIRNQNTLKNSYLLKNDKQKNMSCIETTISIYYNKLQKNIIPKFICMNF